MNVLILSDRPGLEDVVKRFGDQPKMTMEKFLVFPDETDLIISFGYRHIIPAPLTKQYRGKIFNIHISYLPFNRGASPNFWSVQEKTPKGVTIHEIDAGIDTGNIIARERVEMYYDDTFRTLYDRLMFTGDNMFSEIYGDLRRGNIRRVPQEILISKYLDDDRFPVKPPTYHKTSEIDPYIKHLRDGWDTKIIDYYRSIGG